jgi:hypothetical protein
VSSKISNILICPVVPLNRSPASDLNAVRRFLFEHIRGMDAKHDKRWRRFWRAVFHGDPGEGFELYTGAKRSLRFHRRWMAIETRIFDNQDAYTNRERFRDWLKTGAGHGAYQLVNGVMRFVPASLSYEETSDDEMREFAEHAVEFLRSARAQKKLWRHLKPDMRSEMLETLLLHKPDTTEGA